MADQQDQPSSAPKIIIDSDWKAQAQKERERLAQKEKDAKDAAERARQSATGTGAVAAAAAGTPPATAGAPGPSGQPQGMPPADFPSLVGTLVTQALMYMGAFPDPETGRAIVSLEHAKFHIDLLGVLEEKTKGNLGKEEGEDLAHALNELRLRFVELVQAVAQMKKEGKLRSSGGAGGMGGAGMGGNEWTMGMPPTA